MATDTLPDQLTQLKQFTTVVADTGDFESIKVFEPQDATTNPSLIYKAVQKEAYAPLLERAVAEVKQEHPASDDLADRIMDHLLILFGQEILRIIPGRVSTELDARLAFDIEGSIGKAHELIRLYENKGIERERVLIKLPSTWEGLTAARTLQSEGIRCNMTLLFSLCQAAVAAENGAQLISPFVGRILDWYKNSTGRDYSASEDPGVQSVTQIYHYYKQFDIATEIMGASFRNIGEIQELAGCDLLTISPELLKELSEQRGPLERRLDPAKIRGDSLRKLSLDEKAFRWEMNQDPMATDRLADGIRRFAADSEKLAEMVEAQVLR